MLDLFDFSLLFDLDGGLSTAVGEVGASVESGDEVEVEVEDGDGVFSSDDDGEEEELLGGGEVREW